MLGIAQTNRILEFISIIQAKGAVERADMQTLNTRCFSNPFNTTGDGAPYIYIDKKANIKFGHTYTGASALSEERVTKIMNEAEKARADAPGA